MSKPLFSIGIDAPDEEKLQGFIDSGRLPFLNRIKRNGLYCTHTHTKKYRNERCWFSFLTGINSDKTENSGSVFNCSDYSYYNETSYGKGLYSYFYELPSEYQVGVFDLPTEVSKNLNGFQVTGWGPEINQSSVSSSPPDLIDEIITLYGTDPKAEKIKVYDPITDSYGISSVLPSMYDEENLLTFKDRLIRSITQRKKIILDLIQRQKHDLFVALFPETHVANHMLWHLEYAHLATPHFQKHDISLEILTAIDKALAEIYEQLPEESLFSVFTIDSTTTNTMDVTSTMLLPELIYRWCYPGQTALAKGDIDTAPAEPRTDYSQHWKHEIWSTRSKNAELRLDSPTSQQDKHDGLSWNPANWFKPIWKEMKAFALPSVGDGYIRLNIKGREQQGIIDPEDYDKIIRELTGYLKSAINPRTNQKAVKQVIRTRLSAFDIADDAPPDLIVCWVTDQHIDTLDSPDFGRIGPVPFFRSGGHHPHGTEIQNSMFLFSNNMEARWSLDNGKLEDIPATYLDLIGAERPEHFNGRSLLNRSET